MSPIPHQLIDTAEAATAWIASLGDTGELAVDFEADGLFSYREKVFHLRFPGGR